MTRRSQIGSGEPCLHCRGEGLAGQPLGLVGSLADQLELGQPHQDCGVPAGGLRQRIERRRRVVVGADGEGGVAGEGQCLGGARVLGEQGRRCAAGRGEVVGAKGRAPETEQGIGLAWCLGQRGGEGVAGGGVVVDRRLQLGALQQEPARSAVVERLAVLGGAGHEQLDQPVELGLVDLDGRGGGPGVGASDRQGSVGLGADR